MREVASSTITLKPHQSTMNFSSCLSPSLTSWDLSLPREVDVDLRIRLRR